MPTLTEQLDHLYSTTFQLRRPELFDQITTATPIFYLLTEKGRIRQETGGRFIEERLRYGKNQTIQFIRKGGTVTIQPTDVVTTSHWNWKYLTGHITRYFVDEQKARGSANMKNMVNENIDILRDDTIGKVEEYLFSDGTDDDGAAMNGLGNLVPTDPTTGTVGGLNRDTYDWWRSQTLSMSGEDVTVYLLDRMVNMWNTCGQYGNSAMRFPDVVITSQDVHEAYESQAAAEAYIIRNDNKKFVDLGFGDLVYKGVPFVWSPQCASTDMYFLNLDFMRLVVDKFEWFTLGDWLSIYDQPRDKVAHMMSVLNLVVSSMPHQGKIHSISP